MKGVDFALGNYVKAFKDKPLAYLRLSGPIRGFYWLLWMEANRSGLIPVSDACRDDLGEALGVILQVDPTWAQECIVKLMEKGFVSFSGGQGGNAIVVTDYVKAQTTATLDKVRAREYRQRQHDQAVSSSSARGVTPRDDSSQTVTNKDQIRDRSDQISPYGEFEGDKPPTIPPPTTPSQQLDRVVGKGPASWGMDGSGSKPKDPGQDQLRTKHALAAPPAGRHEPIVPVVAPKPIQTTLDVSTTQPGAATGTPTTPAKTKGGKRASVEGKVPIPDDFAPNQADYDHGAKYYGYKKEHVDVEAEACRNQYQASGKEYKDWHALFRNFLGWQYEKRGNKPPFVPPPREPKRPMPPTPPMRADVAEAAERIGKEMAAGKIINVRDLFKRRAHSFSDDCETTTSETTTGQT